MNRLRELRAYKHPEYSELTHKYLRNQVAALKKRNFIGTAAMPTQQIRPTAYGHNRVNQDNSVPQTVALILDDLKEHIVKGPLQHRNRNICGKMFIHREAINKMNTILESAIDNGSGLFEISCLVYAAACSLVPGKKS